MRTAMKKDGHDEEWLLTKKMRYIDNIGEIEAMFVIDLDITMDEGDPMPF